MFGLLFFVLALMFFWFGDFQPPRLLFGEIHKTQAVVVGYDLHFVTRNAKRQRIRFQYQVGDSIYEGVQNLHVKFGTVPIGSVIEIEYEQDDPMDKRVDVVLRKASMTDQVVYQSVVNGKIQSITQYDDLVLLSGQSRATPFLVHHIGDSLLLQNYFYREEEFVLIQKKIKNLPALFNPSDGRMYYKVSD